MPQRDGPSCPGCGLPNCEGLCPVCRGDYPGYVEELQPYFGPWSSPASDQPAEQAASEEARRIAEAVLGTIEIGQADARRLARAYLAREEVIQAARDYRDALNRSPEPITEAIRLDAALAALPATESAQAENPLLCDYCGSLGWTVERYGRVTHKEGCPHRTDPWSQGYPKRTAEGADPGGR